MTDKLKYYLEKYRHYVSYIICGGLTTLVNWIVFFGLYNLFSVNHDLANAIAWVASVAFAFAVNRSFVFHSRRRGFLPVLEEGATFALGRLASFACEQALMFLGADVLRFNPNLVKLAVTAVTTVINYVFSRWVVFRARSGES